MQHKHSEPLYIVYLLTAPRPHAWWQHNTTKTSTKTQQTAGFNKKASRSQQESTNDSVDSVSVQWVWRRREKSSQWEIVAEINLNANFTAFSTTSLLEIKCLRQNHATLDIRHCIEVPNYLGQSSVFTYWPQGEDMHIRTWSRTTRYFTCLSGGWCEWHIRISRTLCC